MFAAHGLAGHIRNNDLRASALLAGFAAYVGLLWFAACLLFSATGLDVRMVTARLASSHQLTTSHWAFALETARHVAVAYAWAPVLLATGWLIYAYVQRRQLVQEGTGAQPTSRVLEPRLYNIVEALAIGAGMPMPGLEIIETDARNAYASGWTPADSVVGVTRGLLRSLSNDELEAVLAHEMTHIRTRDVRLMTVAAIFVGVLVSGGRMLGGPDGARTRNLALRTSGGAGILVVALAVVVGALASVLGVLSHLALSRPREYLADAGAVELTKNPDALISALQKISAPGEILSVPAAFAAMMIASPFEGWMATHPSIESRIAALETYAGGRRAAVPSPQPGLPPTLQPGVRRPGMGPVAASTTSSGPVRSFGRRASAL